MTSDPTSRTSKAAEQRSFLARRLTLAMATPLLVLVGMASLLGWQMLRLSDDLEWVRHSDAVIDTGHRALLEVIDQETSLRGYLLADDPRLLGPFRRANPRETFAQLHELVADNSAQQARFDRAHKAYEEWIALAMPVSEGVGVEQARQPASVTTRMMQMDRVRDAMQEAILAETQIRIARAGASSDATSRMKLSFLILFAGAAASLAFLSRRQLRAIATTFGSALDAEAAARQETEAEAWVRAAQARLSVAMQGEQTVDQVGNACLGELVTSTHADVGAVFIADGRGWKRIAGHALDSRAAGPARFDAGEGVIGRVADEGKLLELRDLPLDFLKVRSGTGEASPSEVIVFPASIDGRTFAVVELGFLRAPERRARDLLHRVGESIGAAIKSADYKHQLRELLQKTQTQSEELQTQQEELRTQNEELEERGHALQRSKTQLENQQAELEQINSQLEEQTHALERQRDNLTRAQAELEQSSRYKSEFLANMSHELRTPLNSSLILAKLLMDNREGNLNDEQVKFAQTIYSAGNDLLTLINDILDLSKIEAGKLDVRPEVVNIKRMTEELASVFDPIAKDKQLAFETVIEPNVGPTMYSDPTRLQQILKNLLSNALKFTDRGRVTLRVREGAGGTIELEVKDTGVGIAPHQHELVFEAFRQADGASNRKHGGTGLGLSISRDLARLLGGDIAITSAVGQGSTFTLRLPVRYVSTETKPTVTAPPPRPSVPKVEPRLTPAPLASHDDRDRLTPGARILLIIEDDPAFARILYDLAHELDYRALIADSAAEGLALAAQHRPHAVLLDVRLPDRSGLSVLDALKHDPALRHVPVHMMSVDDLVQPALAMGAIGFAVKPVERTEIVDAIRRLEKKLAQGARRVLVVEDDDVHRESTCKLLSSQEVECIAVGTAAAALELLRTSTFDCMVLDLSLPDRNGFELLEEMAQQEKYSFPPVIVYTGRSLTRAEEQQLRQFSSSIIIKGARSPERLLDEVTLFLHQVEADLPADRQRMLRDARHRESVFEGRRILVVEDDVRNIFALSAVLEPKGAKVEIARNGREALTHLATNPGVDLVLMDVMMPEMDGLEAMREIRKQSALAKLPIIALTAKAMADDRDACLSAGANDYIAKPLDVDKLLSLARVWMPR